MFLRLFRFVCLSKKICFLLDFVVLLRVCVDSDQVLRRRLRCCLSSLVPIAAARPSSDATTRSPRRLTVEFLSVWLVMYLLVGLMFLWIESCDNRSYEFRWEHSCTIKTVLRTCEGFKFWKNNLFMTKPCRFDNYPNLNILILCLLWFWSVYPFLMIAPELTGLF